MTFTTRAAGELRGRLQQLGVPRVQARTFHSAALRQAQYFWPRVHGGELPSVLDNRMSLVAESAHRLRISVDTAKLRDLSSEISWAKVSNTSPEDYPRIAAAGNRQIASVDAETIARVFAGYEAAKRDRGRIDFEDILLCAAGLLSEHAESAARSSGRTGIWSSTSTRTSVPFSRPCSTCGPASAATCASSATPRRRSTPSPARGRAI